MRVRRSDGGVRHPDAEVSRRPPGDASSAWSARLLTVLALVLAGVTTGGCFVQFTPVGCAADENEACRADGECRCGFGCSSNGECLAGEVCAPATVGTGACVDSTWYNTPVVDAGTDTGPGTDASVMPDGGGNPVRDGGGRPVSDGGTIVRDAGTADPCGGTCTTAEICVTYTGGVSVCEALCTSDATCSTGCCAALDNGQRACLDASFCGSGSPCGACYSDERCIDWAGYGYECSYFCNFNSDCPSGCCVDLGDGTATCAPSGAYCGRNSCGGDTCTTGEQCVSWTGFGYSCSDFCTTGADCLSGCCIGLSDGSAACAPSDSYCGGSGGTCGNDSCISGEQCVDWQGYGPLCSDFCQDDWECGSGCCVGLSDGSYTCAPDATYCSSVPTCGGFTCDPFEACVTWSGYGDLCSYGCTFDSDCASGCCSVLSDGSTACAPDLSFCP